MPRRKNTKSIDPRYFLEETALEEGEAYEALDEGPADWFNKFTVGGKKDPKTGKRPTVNIGRDVVEPIKKGAKFIGLGKKTSAGQGTQGRQPRRRKTQWTRGTKQTKAKPQAVLPVTRKKHLPASQPANKPVTDFTSELFKTYGKEDTAARDDVIFAKLEKALLPQKYWWKNRPSKSGKDRAAWDSRRVQIANVNRKKVDHKDFNQYLKQTIKKSQSDISDPTWTTAELPHGGGEKVRTSGGHMEGTLEYYKSKWLKDCMRLTDPKTGGSGRFKPCQRIVNRRIKKLVSASEEKFGKKRASAAVSRVAQPGRPSPSEEEKNWFGTGFTKNSSQARSLRRAMSWIKNKKNVGYADKIIKQVFKNNTDKMMDFLSAYSTQKAATPPAAAKVQKKKLKLKKRRPKGTSGSIATPAERPKEKVATVSKKENWVGLSYGKVKNQLKLMGVDPKENKGKWWLARDAKGKRKYKYSHPAREKYREWYRSRKRRKGGKGKKSVIDKSKARSTGIIDKKGKRKLDPKFMSDFKKAAARLKKKKRAKSAPRTPIEQPDI